VERRTLPTDLPGPSRRRPFTKRHSPSAEACSSGGSSGGGGTGGSVITSTGSGMQTSCSLPETPVFARGSDIPRTPQHAGNPTQSRRQPGWYAPTTATGWASASLLFRTRKILEKIFIRGWNSPNSQNDYYDWSILEIFSSLEVRYLVCSYVRIHSLLISLHHFQLSTE